VHGVAKGIVNGCNLGGDFGIQFPDIGPGHPHIFGKAAVGVDADNFHVLADMGLTGTAEIAPAADKMAFGADPRTDGQVIHTFPQRRHLAAEFVPEHQGRLDAAGGPGIPVVNMDIGTADGGSGDFYQHLAVPGLGNRNLLQSCALFRGMLDQSLHSVNQGYHSSK